jgi:hypothetical protein
MYKIYKYSLILIVLFSSCNKTLPLTSKMSGTHVKILRSCSLFNGSSDSKIFGSVSHQLIVDDGTLSNPAHNIPAGETIFIEGVYKITSDTRGPWIGVKGHWISKVDGQINFVYCWSNGSKLLIAPWEPDSYPETRTFNPKTEVRKSIVWLQVIW